MSPIQINHSSDLKRLRDEGYNIEVQSGYLLLKDVPYINTKKEIKFGTLVSVLEVTCNTKVNCNTTAKPQNHVAHFIGEYPCYSSGLEIAEIRHPNGRETSDLGINHSFSRKPKEGYKDYYDKMTTYLDIISGPAVSLNPSLTAKTFPVFPTSEEESVLKYVDTASSRAGIVAVTNKLELDKIAIVGLGGTGSYVLDLVAKTPVKEIHLFDEDEFLTHNAFRAPSAASFEELSEKPKKVAYLGKLYSKMRRNIFPHDYHINSQNVNELQGMNFVFLCLEGGVAKLPVVEHLESWGTPFIDVGIGVHIVNESLIGAISTTTSTAQKRDHVRNMNRIVFSDDAGNNEYAQNIQIADLNCLNAVLAVIKWKKLCGFYYDSNKEHFSIYSIGNNSLINEDQ